MMLQLATFSIVASMTTNLKKWDTLLGTAETLAAMSVDWRELYRRAMEVAQRAHAPYSGLHVGAAGLVVGRAEREAAEGAEGVDDEAAAESKRAEAMVDAGDGLGGGQDAEQIITGCNVENASYGLTLCAECAMVSEFHAGGYASAGGRLVAVACVDGDGNPLTPCGRCRQLLLEAGGFGLIVNEHHTIADLLPGAFTPEDLPENGRAVSPEQVAPASNISSSGSSSFASAESKGDANMSKAAIAEASISGAAMSEAKASTSGAAMTSETKVSTSSSTSPTPAFSMQDILAVKAAGQRITDDQIRWFISSYTAGSIPDEQASSLLMAIRLCGMEADELAVWTAAVIDSGERLDLASLPRPTVDKHSTGGVGDKISLILAPLVAACGAAVPQLSGRGLGHTGGTLDKLEAIAGWRASLSNDEIFAQLRDTGAVICAAGAGLAPADRKLYALRDVTGTVESIPLIASSIMSKKIAEGTAALVLDVKVGSGAFMKDEASARSLAEAMVKIGSSHGVATSALLTNMQTPLGLTAGNAVEVAEATEVLAGGGPADVRELTLALAREMTQLAQLDTNPEAVLDSGAAMDKWREMIAAQDGDPDASLPEPRETEKIPAPASGYLAELDALSVGIAAWRLGAGRASKEDPVSAAAGITWHARPGDAIKAGDTLFTLQTDDPSRIPAALEALEGSFAIADAPPAMTPVVLGRVE